MAVAASVVVVAVVAPAVGESVLVVVPVGGLMCLGVETQWWKRQSFFGGGGKEKTEVLSGLARREFERK